MNASGFKYKPRMLGTARLAQWIRNRIVGKPVILLYHRIASVTPDPWDLCVTPEHFAEQLSVLKNKMQVLPLQQLMHAPRRGVSRPLVSVTFDDGYSDNLYNAKPLLEKFGVPATVFAVSGQLTDTREFWWDELEKILLRPGKVPPILQLTLGGKAYEWQLGEAENCAQSSSEHLHWKASGKEDPTKRHGLYRALYPLLQRLLPDERRKVMDALLEWSDAPVEARASHRSLTSDELQSLGKDGLVEIGAHTVTHPVLSALPVPLQRQEIAQSKVDLEEVLGRPITSFAYPHGGRSHYTLETVDVVKQTGFGCACSAFGGFVQRDTDWLQVPRYAVPDLGGEGFAQWLHTLS